MIKIIIGEAMDTPIFEFAIREDLQDTGDLFLPNKGEEYATGWDVKAAFEDRKPLKIHLGGHAKIPLGFRTFAPKGWWLELKARSSTFAKKKLHSLYGTIDETYEGQLIFACQYLPSIHIYKAGDLPVGQDKEYLAGIRILENIDTLTIQFGEAIGQIIPVRRQDMIASKISNEEFERLCQERKGSRGAGGFGSTDK